METNDLIRRAEDLAARCERTSSVTATAFLTPAERMELQNAPSLRSAAVVYSGGGTECERTCAFFLPFYLTAEELSTITKDLHRGVCDACFTGRYTVPVPILNSGE